MVKLFKIVLAVALIMLLLIGLEASFGFWSGSPEPRAFRPIRWIVQSWAGRPLGLDGLTFWSLAAAGSAVALAGSGLAARGQRPERIQRSRSAPAPLDGRSPDRRRRLGAAANREPVPTAEDTVDFASLFNLDRAIEPTPAWRLVATAPDQATSWLGGLPHAAGAFDWPVSADGRPMLFLAQIDLAAIPAPGLPREGALLFFVGIPNDQGWDYQVRTVAQADIAAGAPVSPPAGAVTPGEVGWNQAAGPTLRPTPLRLETYLDTETDAPVSKLFGVEVQDAYGFPYPDGYRNLLYIEHHARLGTFSEHWQGMSIACPAVDLERGTFDGGRIYGTSNG